MKKIKAIVIDDESLNRDLITNLVHNLNLNFEIIAQAENINIAYEMINVHKPDLIFLDIKMPEGSGFELLSRFEKPDFEVVFITGFDEYAMKAFEFNALDYVLKPLDSDKLKVTLQRVSERVNAKKSITQYLREIVDSYNVDYSKISKIPVHHNNKVILIDIMNIIVVETYKGCTIFKTKDLQHYISSKQLDSFEFIFDNYSNFCRINKSAYINIPFIASYTKGSDCTITMIDESEFEISRRKKTEILTILEKNNITRN